MATRRLKDARQDEDPDISVTSRSDTPLSWEYVSGVFDVSGTVCRKGREDRLRFSGYDKNLLQRIRVLAGGGSISGERHSRGTYYRLTITGRYRIARVLNNMLPHLQRKRELVEDWLKLQKVKAGIASIRRSLEYNRGKLKRGKYLRRELRQVKTAIRQLTPP